MEKDDSKSEKKTSGNVPQTVTASRQGGENDYAKNNLVEVPTISIPKGGGSIKSIDEKFSVNAVNGTAAFSIPLPVSPARGVTPSLTLAYNSGSGNGIFGLGWEVGLPSIKRETSKGLPRYYDAIDSDIFLFSEAEDLVPDLEREAQPSPDNLSTIRYYRPRIEGLFSRIERWTEIATGIIKWRVITKENVTTLFGSWQNNSAIANPGDPTKIYKWLPEFIFDDKGNCCKYVYLPEDSTGFDGTKLHNGHREVGGVITYTNLYLSKVIYGNKTPYQQLNDPYPADVDFLFQTVFDYGTLNETGPDPDPVTQINPWDFRMDAFSDYKAGFEIRTTRLCNRVLLFHFFSELAGGSILVKSLNFSYDTTSESGFTFLQAITSYGYDQQTNGDYISNNLPSMEFAYQKVDWNSEVNSISPENLTNAPVGLDESLYQFTDLFNEGLSGILTEQAGGWYYKHNLGEGNFEPAKLVSPKPSFTGLGNQLQLADLDADGGKQLVNYGGAPKGYFELYDFDGWQPFRSFPTLPNIDLKDSNTRLIDLNGDGMADVLITEHNVFTWYESYGREGFSEARRTFQSFDEEQGPRIVFADPTQSVFLADMSGDGLIDIVRIRNGDVCYWPNLGFGKFGAKIGMDNAPVFDYPDAFNPAYIKLADIDGSGTTDIIYLSPNKFTCWLNLNGNSFPAAPYEIDPFPEINSRIKVTVTDLLGNGVPCIVWSSPLPQDANTPLKYIDLMDSKKPHIMVSYSNGLGKEVSLQYTPSTKFYVQDKLAGTPWVTKLHFPVQCVSTVTIYDSVSDNSIASEYTYHHGYYDHPEKEFRGFGRVEQTDAEIFDVSSNPLDQPVVLTKTWFHTGAYLGINRILNQFAGEYFQNKSGFAECQLPDPILPPSYTTLELREALRSCKSMILRREVYALDAAVNPALAPYPYTAEQHNYGIQMLQPRGNTIYAYAVFLTTESEAITYHYERNPADPRILHSFNLETDPLGNVTQSLTVVYQRQPIANLTSPGGIVLPGGQSIPSRVVTEQQTTYFTCNENNFIPPIDDATDYRHSVLYEAVSYELNDLALAAGESYFKFTDLQTSVGAILATNNSPQRRKLKHKRVLFAENAALSSPLGFGIMQSLGIEYETYHLVFTDTILNNPALNGYFSAALLPGGAYKQSTDLAFPAPVDSNTEWWVPAGTKNYGATPEANFYLPQQYIDAFGNTTTIGYDGYNLLIVSVKDPVGNTTTANYDYRTMLPLTVTDINNNVTSLAFDTLGLVVGMALNGKIEGGVSEADNLTGFLADLDAPTIAAFFSDPLTQAASLLANATSRFIYDFTSSPVRTGIIERENHTVHFTDPRLEIVEGALQVSFEYADGFGRVAMKKVQADFGIISTDNQNNCINDGTTPRWVGTGKTVWNNKANPVMQYEPYFSATFAYEVLPPTGVSPVKYYDPTGRVIKTTFPDGTLSYTDFDAWMEIVYDQNDAVEDSPWWVTNSASADPIIQDVVAKTQVHANTPTINYYDTSGRNFYVVAYNTYLDSSNHLASQFHHAQTIMDIEGNHLTVLDDIAISDNVPTRKVMQYLYNLVNEVIYQNSMDGGQRWMLNDCLNKPYYKWDLNEISGTTYNYQYTYLYDALHRPTQSLVAVNGASPEIIEFIQYGDDPTAGGTGAAGNLMGKMYKHYDGAGLVTNYQFDFSGNLIESSRIVMSDYTTMPVWTSDVNSNGGLLQTAEYFSQTQYDALKRVVMITAPYLAGNAAVADVIVHGYGESGLLKTVDAYLRGSANSTSFVKNICHNEKGQRTCIWYGNNMVTRYSYDPDTFRLTNLTTTASAQQTGNTYSFQTLQNLNYTYDPIGNLTYVNDLAQITVFTNNQQVIPSSSYTYDAVYRLIQATGRQHTGQNLPANYPSTNNDSNWMVINPAPADMTQLQNYVQSYIYDSVGNMLSIKNTGTGAGGSWSRAFTYTTGNNQLVNSNPDDIDSGAASGITYPYDTHGNMLKMAHLNTMDWNVKDELQHLNLLGGGDTYYQYDGGGQRVRKVWVKNPSLVCDRIYLNGFEIYVEQNGSTINLQRETLHIMDDIHRIALVETKTADPDNGDTTMVNTPYIRYQHSNHLGTSCLEMDEAANIISYEEYYPFGSTSYQALNTAYNPIAKRYRYTGKERDEESGLYYHGARYYAPWLCRWTAADPLGLKDGVNVYTYSGNRPVCSSDPTGFWEWPSTDTLKKVGVIVAVVVVGVGVTALTAGAAGPAVGAVAIGLLGEGAAATVASGVVVGAFAGAAGGAASELTRQVGSGEKVNTDKILDSSFSGAVGGAVTGGLGSAATAVRSAKTAVTTVSTATKAAKALDVAKKVAAGAATGAAGSGAAELARQAVQEGKFSGKKLLKEAGTGAIAGAGVALASAAGQAARSAVRRALPTGKGTVSTNKGTLTPGEQKSLQDIANKYKTDLEIVGSRGKGEGRNIHTDLPVGKGEGTRSDIDVRIDGQADIDSGGRLSHDIANVPGGAAKVMSSTLPDVPSTPPFIRISPQINSVK